MLEEMSMFKKMKERISDEVNLATNKLQNMQLIDQLASTIGQQTQNDITPNQLLPEPQFTQPTKNNHCSLLDGGPIAIYHEEEELNSDISPQHQLFNERSIKRLDNPGSSVVGGGLSNGPNSFVKSISEILFDSSNVIKFGEICSDIEEDPTEALDSYVKDGGSDTEIDLLSDKPVPSQTAQSSNGVSAVGDKLTIFKTRYRSVVHAIRALHSRYESEKSAKESQLKELSDKIERLNAELKELKSIAKKENQLIVTASDDEKTATNTQLSGKQSNKIRDLERLLSQCKESLKQKNSQIIMLKESLADVERFRDSNQDLKRELNELKEAHETWTVSIAENKRVMHQEIENKNIELDRLKSDLIEQQNQLADNNSIIKNLKTKIQDLESRLVSTSAAHQKERDSLTKELTVVKNNAIRQLQKENELNLERVKLDLEKFIEALKHEVLIKDEQIIKTTEKNQELQDRFNELTKELEETSKRVTEQRESLTDYEKRIKQSDEVNSSLREQIESLKAELLEQMSSKVNTPEEILPNSTEFEYLKNIVYQFMLGKQPLVLARVISAVFKFDKDQVEQICRIQEAIHSVSRQNP